MNKIIKKIFILLVITFSIIGFCSYNAKAEDTSEYQKGQLKCPDSFSNKNITGCKEETDANGNVVSATLTYYEKIDGRYIQIDKKVKKTDVIGKYTVQFTVKGNLELQKIITERVNVVIVFDKSKTMSSSSKKKAISAIKTFTGQLTDNNDNFYVALVQFAKNATKQKNVKFQNTKINSITGDFGISSHLEKALNRAYNALYPTSAGTSGIEGKKYIVVFGDGRYYLDYPSNTCNGEGNGGAKNNCTTRWRESKFGSNSVEYYLRKLNENGVAIYGVRYKSASNSNYSGKVSNKNNYVTDCRDKSYSACDELYMDKVANRSVAFAGDSENFTDQFTKIFNNITDDVEKTASKVSGNLSDLVGSEFDMIEDASSSSRYQNFDIKEITEQGYTTEEFEIEIDPETSRGWHETNENYTFTYTDKDGEKKTITVQDSPEVYWDGDNENIYSCSGDAKKETNEKEEYPYYSKECNDDYKVKIAVDNAADGQKKFTLTNGRGFPTSVKLSTDIKCTYKFKTKEYNDRYAQIVKERANYSDLYNSNDIPENQKALEELKEANEDNKDFKVPTTTKVDIAGKIAQLDSEMDSMVKAKDTYKSLVGFNKTTSPDIDTYKENFIDQKATVKVYYENSSDYDELDLIDLNDPNLSGSCKVGNGSIDGVPDNKTCTFHFEREMGLPEVCIDMQDATQAECEVDDNNQLNGGNRFYIDLEEESGSVSVVVPDAGYYQNTNFILDKDENGDPACTFDNSTERLEYRTIEVNDPFLTSYDPNRGVGKNYLNSQFNFQKIIQGDIWNNKYEPEYYYLMSKTNVLNIKNNTKEDYASSYLGRNCYFTNNNKWHCEFTRNENNGSDNGNDWFYDYKVNDELD